METLFQRLAIHFELLNFCEGHTGSQLGGEGSRTPTLFIHPWFRKPPRFQSWYGGDPYEQTNGYSDPDPVHPALKTKVGDIWSMRLGKQPTNPGSKDYSRGLWVMCACDSYVLIIYVFFTCRCFPEIYVLNWRY